MRGGRTARAIALVALVVAAGCATRGDVDYLAEQNQRIEQRQADLEQRVSSLERTMANMQELLTQIRADFKADLGAVLQGLSALESAVRGTETRIEQLRRYTPPPPPAPADTAAGGNGDDAAADAGVVDPIALYNAAITDYRQGRLDLARTGLEEYLRRFPDGLSAPDAQYWLGIVEYDEGDYRGAIRSLGTIPRRWPDSSKAPLALRKIGDAYRELIDRYPDSSEAEAARREMGG